MYLDEWKDTVKVFVDLFYIFIIIIIFQEINSGIIIDTFKDLR
jgi:hypothetical protein